MYSVLRTQHVCAVCATRCSVQSVYIYPALGPCHAAADQSGSQRGNCRPLDWKTPALFIFLFLFPFLEGGATTE